MHLKNLIITSKNSEKTIRHIDFHLGTNLIVDETLQKNDHETGNNVGKTTVLALVDYCLGGDTDQIYKDPETKKSIQEVKSFLEDEEVLITLILKEDLEKVESREIKIERNFLSRSRKIMSINGENLPSNRGKDFIEKLDKLIIGDRDELKPTFRQIIAHNIRYKDKRINNTLKVLDTFTSVFEYETLFLFMFNLPLVDRSNLNKRLNIEKNYKRRLEKLHSKSELEISKNLIDNNIQKLEEKKNSLNINENYERELKVLNDLKGRIYRISSRMSDLVLRKQLLLETEEELQNEITDIDMVVLKGIYTVAKREVSGIQKTFEQMVEYHNKMVIEKIRFIMQDLPEIERELSEYESTLSELLTEERKLSEKITKSDTFIDLENIIAELTKSYQRKGELEGNLDAIEEADKTIARLEKEIDEVDDRFSPEFEKKLKKKVEEEFTFLFAEVSQALYKEEFALKCVIEEHKMTKQSYYDFDSFNANLSSGKKQGEIICFDIAYILFARKEGVPILNFILNDKKELMHDNQLKKVSKYAKENKIQLVFSILQDKLPNELSTDEHIILRLSEESKLFRIEEIS